MNLLTSFLLSHCWFILSILYTSCYRAWWHLNCTLQCTCVGVHVLFWHLVLLSCVLCVFLFIELLVVSYQIFKNPIHCNICSFCVIDVQVTFRQQTRPSPGGGALCCSIAAQWSGVCHNGNNCEQIACPCSGGAGGVSAMFPYRGVYSGIGYCLEAGFSELWWLHVFYEQTCWDRSWWSEVFISAATPLLPSPCLDFFSSSGQHIFEAVTATWWQ